MSEEGPVRLHVFFSGRVQGVGFRFTTIHVAHGFDVVGFVRNLPDGRVELAAEGTREELENFLAAVQQRMGRYVREADASWLAAAGGFTEFQIRY